MLKRIIESFLVYLVKMDDSHIFTKWIRNPSEKVQLAIVEHHPWSISHIKNPTEMVQISAIYKHTHSVIYIDNPSERVQLAAVTTDVSNILGIQKPSEKAQLYVMSVDPYLYETYIRSRNPIERVNKAWFTYKVTGNKVDIHRLLGE